MTTHLIDILKYQHDLKQAGVPEEQAEIHAKKLAELIDGKLVTREYLDNKLLIAEQHLDNKLNTLLLRIGGMMVASVGILFVLLKYHS